MLEKAEGRWALLATGPDGSRTRLTVRPVQPVSVVKRRVEAFPDYVPEAWGGWQKGFCLPELRTQECSSRDALDPDSLRIESESGELFEFGRDYDGDPAWGSFGRLPDGRIPAGGTVLLSYRYFPQRLDSVVLNNAGQLEVREGELSMATPEPPPLKPGECRIGNVFFCGRPEELSEQMLFPIYETAYPETDFSAFARRLLPQTLAKLRCGEPLRVLAWGDSVTAASYLPSESLRWQEQFVERLRKRFPKAAIELKTVAWGGKCSSTFLETHPGYEELVLGAEPDLVISEFVNDAGLPAEEISANYNRFKRDFNAAGIEWIILTPHYIRPDWMGLDRQNDIDDDPRLYVKMIREFAVKNAVALADASLRYGRLWRQGIPYNTLMSNSINHPVGRGHAIFADALTALFPDR